MRKCTKNKRIGMYKENYCARYSLATRQFYSLATRQFYQQVLATKVLRQQTMFDAGVVF